MTLSEDIKRHVDSYFSNNSAATLSTLSRKTGLPYSTLRRMATGEGEPSYKSVIAVLMATTNRAGVIAFLQNHFPDQADVLERLTSKTVAFSNEDLDSVTRDETSSIIVGMVGTRTGATVDQIKRLFGEIGLRKLDQLKDQDIVVDQNGKLSLSNQNYAFSKPEAGMENIISHAKNFDFERIGHQGCCMGDLSESVSEKGADLLKAEMIKFLSNVRSIFEKNPGSVAVYVKSFMNLYDSEQLKGSVQ